MQVEVDTGNNSLNFTTLIHGRHAGGLMRATKESVETGNRKTFCFRVGLLGQYNM